MLWWSAVSVHCNLWWSWLGKLWIFIAEGTFFLILMVRRSVMTETVTHSVGGENVTDVSCGSDEIPYYHVVIPETGITEIINKICLNSWHVWTSPLILVQPESCNYQVLRSTGGSIGLEEIHISWIDMLAVIFSIILIRCLTLAKYGEVNELSFLYYHFLDALNTQLSGVMMSWDSLVKNMNYSGYV